MPDSLHSVQTISAVAINLAETEMRLLKDWLEHRKWTLNTAGDCQNGVAVAAQGQAAVVITEARLPDGNWRNLLDGLGAFEVPPRLIVTSRAADESLWAEVLDMGGFDVFAQPLDRAEVLRVLDLAWSSWKQEWDLRVAERLRRAGTA